MHFDQLSESARELINETFGEDEPIVFHPQGGKSYEIRGVFQSLYREVDPFGFEITSERPNLTCGAIEFHVPPTTADRLTVRGRSYRVVNVLKRPAGTILLELHHVP